MNLEVDPTVLDRSSEMTTSGNSLTATPMRDPKPEHAAKPQMTPDSQSIGDIINVSVAQLAWFSS